MSLHAARVLISTSVLRDVLDLPEDAEIIQAGVDDRRAGIITLTIIHPTLPEVPDGVIIPDASPTLMSDNVHLVPSVKMLDWGVHKP